MGNVQVKWVDGESFLGIDSSKHSLVMSSQDAANGIGCKPSDLLLLALGGCAAVDIVGILRKQRQQLVDFEISIEATQDADPPWTFRAIHVDYLFKGHDLSPSAVERAIELSENKYCSVGTTLAPVVAISHSYRIEES